MSTVIDYLGLIDFSYNFSSIIIEANTVNLNRKQDNEMC